MLTRFAPVADLDRFSSEVFGAFSRRAGSMPIDASTIDLTVDRNVLRIEASRNWRPAQGDLVLAAERPRGSFARQLVLSEDIDTGSIQADYHDGVLTVVLPVAETAKPRKVTIGTSGQPTTVEASTSEQQAA
jgi:HSP20 family protein